MRIITFAAQKGGVGKTTLAVNLAVAAEVRGIKTALADLDPQESATAWDERRSAEAPHVEALSVRRLPAWLGAARDAGVALAIIDTPPAAGPEALDAVKLADMALIPCRASLIDLEAIQRTAQLVTLAGKPGVAILNAVPHAARHLIGQAHQLIASTGLTNAPLVIRDRAAYRHAWPLGLGVTEHEPASKAANEIDALLLFVTAHMNIAKA